MLFSSQKVRVGYNTTLITLILAGYYTHPYIQNPDGTPYNMIEEVTVFGMDMEDFFYSREEYEAHRDKVHAVLIAHLN